MGLRQYPVWDLEAKAEEIYRLDPEVFSDPPPVNIEYFIESRYELLVGGLPFSKYGLLGMVAIGDDGTDIAIVVKEGLLRSEKLPIYNFTLAEELAHIHLHLELLRGTKHGGVDGRSLRSFAERLRQPREDGGFDPVERNARRLAEYLLMPKPMVLNAIRRAAVLLSPPAWRATNATILDHMIPGIAQEFEVNPNVLKYRLEHIPEVEQLLTELRKEGLANVR